MTISDKLQSIFIVTLSGLSIPILILNLLGGIISGIWLAILGEWGEITRGLFFIIVSSFAISFALMPGLLFAAPAAIAEKRGKRFLVIFFGSLSILYTITVITIWCVWILWLFMSSTTESSLIPLLIWSYGVALVPWMWLAQKDQQAGGNEFSIISTFFAQISYILVMIMFFMGATFEAIIITFGTTMIIGAALQISIAFTATEKQKEYESFSQIVPDNENIVDKFQYLKIEKKSSNAQKLPISYCGKCGNKLKDSSKFCSKCGVKI